MFIVARTGDQQVSCALHVHKGHCVPLLIKHGSLAISPSYNSITVSNNGSFAEELFKLVHTKNNTAWQPCICIALLMLMNLHRKALR